MSHGEVRAAVKKLERRIEDTNGGFLTDVEVDRDTLRMVLEYANAKMGVKISDLDPLAGYEVGETVLIGDDFMENAPQYVGEVGEIVHIEVGEEYPFYVKFEDRATPTCWNIGELRKVEQKA
jgi:hypothetical protein